MYLIMILEILVTEQLVGRISESSLHALVFWGGGRETEFCYLQWQVH